MSNEKQETKREKEKKSDGWLSDLRNKLLNNLVNLKSFQKMISSVIPKTLFPDKGKDSGNQGNQTKFSTPPIPEKLRQYQRPPSAPPLNEEKELNKLEENNSRDRDEPVSILKKALNAFTSIFKVIGNIFSRIFQSIFGGSDNTSAPGGSSFQTGNSNTPEEKTKQENHDNVGPSRRQNQGNAGPSRGHDLGDTGPSREHDLGDTGPSRKQNQGNAGPSREHDLSDTSPSRRQNQGNAGPSREHDLGDTDPSRKQNQGNAGPSREHDPGDTSPSRKQNQGNAGPSREHDLSDTSPSRKQNQGNAGPSRAQEEDKDLKKKVLKETLKNQPKPSASSSSEKKGATQKQNEKPKQKDSKKPAQTKINKPKQKKKSTQRKSKHIMHEQGKNSTRTNQSQDNKWPNREGNVWNRHLDNEVNLGQRGQSGSAAPAQGQPTIAREASGLNGAEQWLKINKVTAAPKEEPHIPNGSARCRQQPLATELKR